MSNAEWTGTEELVENELRDRDEWRDCVRWNWSLVPTYLIEWAAGLGDVSAVAP